MTETSSSEILNRSGEMCELPTPEEQQLKRMVPGNKMAYSVKEAAVALGVSTWFVRAEIKRGLLGRAQVSGRVLIPSWELVRYLVSGERSGPKAP